MAKPKKPRQEVVAAPEQDELGVPDPEEQELPDPEPEADDSAEEMEQVAAEAAAEPEDAPEPNEPSMDALYARATELKIKGRRLMQRRELTEAIALAEAEGSVPAVDEPGGPPEETVDESPARVVTTEQAQKIFAASTEQLEGVVADPVYKDKWPHLVVVVAQELERRASRASHGQQLAARMGPMERFIVTRGGRYITKDGYATHLAEGTLVTPLTHDLRHVQGQGIQFRPAQVTAVRLDEMGRQISEVK